MHRAAITLCLAASMAFTQGLQVTGGAADYQVFQRGADNTAGLNLKGTAAGAEGKLVEARLVKDGRAVAGFDWAARGKVSGGNWTASIPGVPVGGPYLLQLRVPGSQASTEVANLLVGDLWILAGQSNMEGVGNLENLPLPVSVVNSFDQTDQWVNASDPLHRLPDAVDRVHWRNKDAQGNLKQLQGAELAEWMKNRKKGAGVGLTFAIEMVKRTGVPIGLVPSAHGGTSMDQWSPSLKDKGGDSLYGQMLRRHKAVGGMVTGILWYQGESDASAAAAPLFEKKFVDFVAAARSDFAQPDLPFYYVQIGRHVSTAAAAPWNLVQQAQLTAEKLIPRAGMVTCIDCALDDGIHVSTSDFGLLGKRLANLACHDLFPTQSSCGTLKRGPRPVSVKAKDGKLVVEFAEVNGGLTHKGRLNGFTVVDSTGTAVPLIYAQRVSPDNANVVELLYSGKLPEGAGLFYGVGRDPYVNLRDNAEMAAPVFGPFPIQQ